MTVRLASSWHCQNCDARGEGDARQVDRDAEDHAGQSKRKAAQAGPKHATVTSHKPKGARP